MQKIWGCTNLKKSFLFLRKLLGARLQLPERRDGPRFWAFAEGEIWVIWVVKVDVKTDET